MKILYIITKSNWGGAQRHVFDLASFCHKNGHNTVVALGGEGMLNNKLVAQGIAVRGIGSMGRDISFMNDLVSLKDIFNIIRKEKPDILHLHSPKAAGLGAFVGWILKIPKIIYTVHGWTFNESRPLHQRLAIAFFSWLTMLFSTHIITLSEKEMGQAQMFPFVLQKLRMIYLGISTPKFLTQKDAKAFIQSKIPEEIDKKTIVGTIAELHPNKGLIYAINSIENVLKRFPSLIYFIIGEGEQRENLETLIREKGVDKNVILAGHVDNAAQYLKGFSIFLLPSVKEGLPYTLIEAGYAGLPTISTAVGGIPEIIDDMKSGIIIQSKKSEEIVHSLEFLLQHKNIQREHGKNLQEKVKITFNLENMMAKTMEIYTSSL